MNDIHDIKENISNDSLMSAFLIIIILFFFTIFLLLIIKALYKRISGQKKKKPAIVSINYKAKSIEMLNVILQEIENSKNIDFDNVYYRISEIIRWFMTGIYRSNALAMTKTEVYAQLTQIFEDVLTSCYIVEFTNFKASKEKTKEIIHLAIKRIHKCI